MLECETNPDWNPGDTDRLLLAGDETAIDTIAPHPRHAAERRTRPGVPRGAVGRRRRLVSAPGRFAICWLVRDRGQSLRTSVDAWLSEMLPTSGFEESRVYAWIAADGPARLLSSD